MLVPTGKCFLCAIVIVSLLFGISQGDDEWVAAPEFADKLPAVLTPLFETQAATSGECFLYCYLKNCSSVAYSSVYQSCKLYSHPTSWTPLPRLVADQNFRHQMYYKRFFCPAGWEAERNSEMCYFIGQSAALQRPAAWQVCEENLMSNLVTFQTARQRSDLYTILNAKYSNIAKFWTGYAMFDSNLWARPVEELPGYVRRRGDCGGNDIYNYPGDPTPEACAQMCNSKHHDRCVSFVYIKSQTRCVLKYHACDNSGTGNALNPDWWFYDKVNADRPPSLYYSVCPGNDIKSYVGVSRVQCLQNCRAMPHCVAYTYQVAARTCTLKSKSCIIRDGSQGTALEGYEMRDINDGPCPYGIRYRDVCLTYHRSVINFNTAAANCRQLGGKLVTPSEMRKHQLIYAITDMYGSQVWVDYTDNGHEGNWTTLDQSLTLNEAIYDRWPWKAGAPVAGSTTESCARPSEVWSNTVSNGYAMDDFNCAETSKFVCETPITVSWPKTCRFTPPGREFMGRIGVTASGAACKSWSSTTPYTGKWQQFPDWFDAQAYCRNPDQTVFDDNVWCYRNDNGVAEKCNIPLCPESDWASGQNFQDRTRPYSAITRVDATADKYDWTVESITGTANPLCSMSMSDWCPYYFGGSCYKVFNIPNNHDEANAICANNGWHLATITSIDEQHFIIGITERLGRYWYTYALGYHIGLKYTSTGWAWDNGEPFTTGFWVSGQPDTQSVGQCGMLWISQTGYWHDLACWYKSWFICEIELGK